MNVLVTEAIDPVARRVCRALAEAGHVVAALSRDPQRAVEAVPGLRGVFPWDPLSAPPASSALENFDAVVHLPPLDVLGRWTAARRRAMRDARVVASRHLVEGLARAQSRPSRMVMVGSAAVYGDRGDEVLTEASPPGEGFLAGVCLEAEAEAAAAREAGVEVVLIRAGIVLSPVGGLMAVLAPLYRWGLGGPMGGGRQWWSWIHLEDLVGLILTVLVAEEATGLMNAVSPSPARQRDFARTLGRVMGRPAVVPTPGFTLRHLLGGMAHELLASRRVVPEAALGVGYRFLFSDLETALADVVARRRG